MSSTETNKLVPVNISFNDESLSVKKKKKLKTAKGDDIGPFHKKGLGIEEKKKIKEKELKKKREKKKDKKEKTKTGDEAKLEEVEGAPHAVVETQPSVTPESSVSKPPPPPSADVVQLSPVVDDEPAGTLKSPPVIGEPSSVIDEPAPVIAEHSPASVVFPPIIIVPPTIPIVPPPVLAEPPPVLQSDITDKPSGKINEVPVQRTSGKEQDAIMGTPVASTSTIQSEKLDNEQKEKKKGSLRKKKEPKEETRKIEISERPVVKAASRRDFYDNRFESDYRYQDEKGKGSNSSIQRYMNQDCRVRYRRNEMKDAYTCTKDNMFGPCEFLKPSKKELCRDLCEKTALGEGRSDMVKCGGLDRWCEDRCQRTHEMREIGKEDKKKGPLWFCPPSIIATREQGGGSQERGGDWKGNSRVSQTDEMTQLKSELKNLQTELDRLKDCLKAAVVAAEKNKCLITKMKEHIRCNLTYCFPDLSRIREKLKNCHLMKMKLCREFKINSNRDHWRKDFECLMSELNTIKFELEKLRKDKT